MARKKTKWKIEGDMFGKNLQVVLPDGELISVGQNLQYDPISQFDKKLKTGYLFRSPQVDPRELASIWDTLQNFSQPHLIWVEFEKKDDKTELTAFARFDDRGEATMFAFSHSSFEKWSDEKEKADKLERKRKPNKLRVTKDGRIKGTVTIETLGD